MSDVTRLKTSHDYIEVEQCDLDLEEALRGAYAVNGPVVSLIAEFREQVAAAQISLKKAWQQIETAPSKRTVLLSQLGTTFIVAAYRIGPVSGWRHAHSSEEICFKPTHWQSLPDPPRGQDN